MPKGKGRAASTVPMDYGCELRAGTNKAENGAGKASGSVQGQLPACSTRRHPKPSEQSQERRGACVPEDEEFFTLTGTSRAPPTTARP